jgi:hypothetical protein
MATTLGRQRSIMVKFPVGLPELMRPELPSLADEIIQEIRAAIPEYARPMDGPYGQVLSVGVHEALNSFIGLVADPGAPRDDLEALCRNLGKLEAREGRTLDSLQAAYRVGSRVAWHRVMALGQRAGLSSSVMSLLADSVFDYLDELATFSRSGYLAEQARSADIRQEWRRRLLAMILESAGPPAPAVAEIAERVDWVVPDEVTMVAVQCGPPVAVPDGDVLADYQDARPYLLVPGELTVERFASLAPWLGKRRAAIGLKVPLAAASDSLRWARRGLHLAAQGVIRGQVIRCSEHLVTLLLLADMTLAEEVVQTELSALAGLTSSNQRQLVETLQALMDSGGNATEVASRLNLHPQTVRYRLRKAEQILGSRLSDPSARFGLELALRTRRLCNRPPHRGERLHSSARTSLALPESTASDPEPG